MIPDYKKEIEELNKMIPWKDVAFLFMFPETGQIPTIDTYNKVIEKGHIDNEVEKRAIIASIVTTYKILYYELLGMKEYPEKWKQDKNHPKVHIDHIKRLMKMLEEYEVS